MGFFSGIFMGALFGIGIMFGWRYMMGYRSKSRVAKAIGIKLFGALGRDDLKKLCGDNFPEWITFPVYEQVKWLNKQLSKLWPYVAEAATIIIKDSVEPILEEYRPPGITSLKFKKLTLGTVAPKIEGIRVQSLKQGQITMDMDFRWGGDPNIVLGVEAAGVASLPIQLKDLQVFTNIRVIFQLSEEIPCISAVVVALLAEPKPRIDYTLKAVGGSLTAIPGLSDMIDHRINSLVTTLTARGTDIHMDDTQALLVGHEFVHGRSKPNIAQAYTVQTNQSVPPPNIRSMFGQLPILSTACGSSPSLGFKSRLERYVTASFYGNHQSSHNGSAYRNRGGRSRNNNRGSRGGRSRGTDFSWASTQNTIYGHCQQCGIQHIPAQCPNHRDNVGSQPTAYFSSNRSQASTFSPPTWYPDTGANSHVAPDLSSFDFSETYHGSTLCMLVMDTVTSIVTDMLQWPHRIVVPIGAEPVDTSELELKPQGKLALTIVKANDLKNMEMLGKSDPYVVAFIRPLEKVKSKVIENNLNPVWNQTFQLIVEDKETQHVILEVFDQDIGHDERLGIAKLPLADLQPSIEKEVQLKLQPTLDPLKIKNKKDNRGTITLKAKYHHFTKEEQDTALGEEKKMQEEREELQNKGVIDTPMEAVDEAAEGMGSGIAAIGSPATAATGSPGTAAADSPASKTTKFGRTHGGKRGGSIDEKGGFQL